MSYCIYILYEKKLKMSQFNTEAILESSNVWPFGQILRNGSFQELFSSHPPM